MPKIISFCPIDESLRDALRAENYDSDLIYSNAPLWTEALEVVANISSNDDSRDLMCFAESGSVDCATSLTSTLFDDNAPPHVFILPRGGGDVGLLRALVLADLTDFRGDMDVAPATAYAWGNNKGLAKVFPSSED